MRKAVTAAIFALLATPVYAQMPPLNLWQDKPAPSAEQVRKQEAVDKAYKDTINQIPAPKKSDPWGSVRSSEQKPAKTSPKN